MTNPNKGISAEIPNRLTQWQLDAIRWMERESYAYLPAWQKGHHWGYLSHYVENREACFNLEVDYISCYGLFTTQSLKPVYMSEAFLKEEKFKKTTYCTMGFNAFLYHFMGYNTTDNILEIRYGDPDYNKHPVSVFTQNNANKCCDLLASGDINRRSRNYGIGFAQIITPELTVAKLAHEGNLILAAWKNPKGIGHVSTVIGGKLLEPGLIYEYASPMCYNIGSRNGYMSLEDAFFDPKHQKDIKFYVVEKI